MSEKRVQPQVTDRLILREATTHDAAFVLRLYNDPAFLKFVGDKKIRTVKEARSYVEENMINSYRKHGFGLLLVELKQCGTPIGTCGLVHRSFLNDPDIGFAFVEGQTSQGYGFEAATAIMKHGHQTLGLECIHALVAPHNRKSIGLIEKLGLRYVRPVQFPGDDKETSLYATM